MYQLETESIGAIPLTEQNLVAEATEAMTRVQERERLMIAVLGVAFGVLATMAFWRR